MNRNDLDELEMISFHLSTCDTILGLTFENRDYLPPEKIEGIVYLIRNLIDNYSKSILAYATYEIKNSPYQN